MNKPFKKVLRYDESQLKHLNIINASDGFSWTSVRG